MAPLISIAIPTRERGRYLTHCLETTLRCDAHKVEVVVSDNASLDASFIDDPRFASVRFIRQANRLPMAANFEAAFAGCSGDYIVYVGDDDAVIPSGIADLIAVVEARRPDVVSWPSPHYFWPTAGENGSLTIKRRQVRGGVTDQDPREIMRLVWGGLWGNNTVYCGCVSRALVERVRARCGRLFYHGYADARNYGLIALAQTYLYLNRPVTLYGRSPASTASALASPGSAGHAAWRAENSNEVGRRNLDMASRCVPAYALDSLLTTVDLLGLVEPAIDMDRWRARIVAWIASMSEAEHPRELEIVNAWMGAIGQTPVSIPVGRRAAATGGGTWRRPSLGKVTLTTTPTFLANSASAVGAVEHLLGVEQLAEQETWLAAATRWGRVVVRANALRSGIASVPDDRAST